MTIEIWKTGALVGGIFAGGWAGVYPNADPAYPENHIVAVGWNAEGHPSEPRVRMGVEAGFAPGDGRVLSEWMWEYDFQGVSRRPVSAFVDRNNHDAHVFLQGETRFVNNDGSLSWLFASDGRAFFGGYMVHQTPDAAIFYGMSATGPVEVVRVSGDGTIMLGAGGSPVRVNGDLVVDGNVSAAGTYQ